MMESINVTIKDIEDHMGEDEECATFEAMNSTEVV